MNTTISVSSRDIEPKSCPCKKVPLYLSSFTAAEYGDLHSLSRTEKRIDQWSDKEQYGITPLHLAAQNDHFAAVAMMLKKFSLQEGTVTPLHRASFSGAVASMKLLLDDANDKNQLERLILAKDTSFGDNMTALHKAAAGGRYLAVQLLLHTLSSATSVSLRSQALLSTDSQNKTPLEVAKTQLLKDYDGSEQKSVARWDQVAGGVADWNKCVQLLSDASGTTSTPNKQSSSNNLSSSNDWIDSSFPKQRFSAILTNKDCIDCNSGGACISAAWQARFRKALGTSLMLSMSSSKTAFDQSSCVIIPSSTSSISSSVKVVKNSTMTITGSSNDTDCRQSEEEDGIFCSLCGKVTIALYPISGGKLVCKSCKRSIMKQG